MSKKNLKTPIVVELRKGKHKGQKALLVSLSDLEKWAQTALDSTELITPEAPQKHLETPVRHLEAHRERLEMPHRRSEVPQAVSEVSQGTSSHFEAESTLREDLVGALERSQRELRLVERRAIELELALRQSRQPPERQRRGHAQRRNVELCPFGRRSRPQGKLREGPHLAVRHSRP